MPGPCQWVFLVCREDWIDPRKLGPAQRASALLLPSGEQERLEALKQQHAVLAGSFNFGEKPPSRDLVVRGVAKVSARCPFADELSPGWSDSCLALKYAYHGEAKDSYNMEVHDTFLFPVWEQKLLLTRLKYPRCSKTKVQVRWSECDVGAKSHKTSMVFCIEDWTLGNVRPSQQDVADMSVCKPAMDSYSTLGSSVSKLEGLSQLSVLCLPADLVFSVLCGAHHQVPMLARWTHRFFPSLTEGLSAEWLGRVTASIDKERDEVGVREELLTHEALQGLMSNFRKLGQQVIEVTLDEDEACGLSFEVSSQLRRLRNHLYALQVLRFPAASKVRRMKFPSDALVQQVLSSLDLKNKATLQARAAKFVNLLPSALRPFLDSWVSNKIASGSTLNRSELILDMALQLLHRTRLGSAGEVFKFAWGDATDKWDMEIYNARYRWLKKADCVQLARAWRFLCTHPFVKDMDRDLAQKRRELSTLLFQSIHMHTLMPQLRGNKKTALSDKVSAHVHASLLESENLSKLDEHFASHVCWCSDMGTEAGLPSFHVLQAEQVLPDWLRPSRVNIQHADDDALDVGPVFEPGDADVRASPLMPNAVQVPGICHAIHNATGKLNDAFHGFDDFLQKLKTLYRFLGDPQRCSRFVEVAMRGTLHYDRAKQLFLRKLTSIYTERWNVIAICLEESLPLLLFLRAHWDEVRFLDTPDKNAPSAKAGWSPSHVTNIVKDNYFLVFWRMQLAIRKLLLKFTSWAEGCGCHGGMDFDGGALDTDFEKRMDFVLNQEIGCPPGVPHRCPMAGCQAPFLAQDKLSVFEEQLNSTSREFIGNCEERLSQDEWSLLLAEWQHGSRVILEELKTRLDFFFKPSLGNFRRGASCCRCCSRCSDACQVLVGCFAAKSQGLPAQRCSEAF